MTAESAGKYNRQESFAGEAEARPLEPFPAPRTQGLGASHADPWLERITLR